MRPGGQSLIDESNVRVLSPEGMSARPPERNWVPGGLAFLAVVAIGAIAIWAWPDEQSSPQEIEPQPIAIDEIDLESLPAPSLVPNPDPYPGTPPRPAAPEWAPGEPLVLQTPMGEMIWHWVDLANPTDSVSAPIWTGEEFMLVAGKQLLRSPDGVEWQASELPDLAAEFGVDRLELFGGGLIATGWADGTAAIWTSKDGATWTGLDLGLAPHSFVDNGAVEFGSWIGDVVALQDGVVAIRGELGLYIYWYDILSLTEAQTVGWNSDRTLLQVEGPDDSVTAEYAVEVESVEAGLHLAAANTAGEVVFDALVDMAPENAGRLADGLLEGPAVDSVHLGTFWLVDPNGSVSGPFPGPGTGDFSSGHVATIGHELIAVDTGFQYSFTDDPPMVWRSADAQDWSDVDARFAPDARLTITGLANRGDEVLAIGSSLQTVQLTEKTKATAVVPTAWRTLDGVTWEGLGLPFDNSDSSVEHVGGGDLGWAIPGLNCVFVCRTDLFLSADGVEWARFPMWEGEEQGPLLGPHGVAVGDDTIVMAFLDYPDTEPYTPSVVLWVGAATKA